MKNILKNIIICTVGVMLWSCDDFLTEKPATDLFEMHIFANDETAKSALVACYGRLTASIHYGIDWESCLWPNSIFCTTGLDVTNIAGLGATQKEIAQSGSYIIDQTHGGVEKMWRGVYQSLVTINNFIYNVEKASGISEEGKLKFIGEARFLRAFCNFDLIRVWGAAPLKLAPMLTMDDANKPKSPANEFFDSILEDLEYAERYMPTKAEQEVGKPFNYAATALKAKVYAQMATSQYMFMEDDGRTDPYTDADREEFWRLCYAAAKKVYDDKVYALVPDYRSLWQCRNKNTVESIFELQFNKVAYANGWGGSCLPAMSSLQPDYGANQDQSRLRPTKVIYEWHAERYWNKSTYQKDPRIDETYLVETYYRNQLHGQPGARVWVYPATDGTNAEKQGADRYPSPLKYVDPTYRQTSRSDANLMYYRYPDLLLLLAEAANELGDPDNLKFKVVNDILERARKSVDAGDDPFEQPAAWDPSEDRFKTKEGFREQIFRERLCELPMEGLEWFEVRRRGREEFKKWANLYNEGVEKYTFLADKPATGTNAGKDYRVFIPIDNVNVRKLMFLPIPILEINNNGSMTVEKDQNFGY